jgi:hypothetical protein
LTVLFSVLLRSVATGLENLTGFVRAAEKVYRNVQHAGRRVALAPLAARSDKHPTQPSAFARCLIADKPSDEQDDQKLLHQATGYVSP